MKQMSKIKEQAMAVVTCNDIEKTYLQGKIPVRALRDVTLAVEKGEFVCLCGPSGSGKTTLLNLIGGLDKPTAGEIFIAGTRIDRLSRGELADLRLHNIGFIFQSFNLIPVLSARENVEMVMQMQGVPGGERGAKALNILNTVGLGDMADRRPAELSGGQQQRVAVARAIVSNPSIVLADEPTANLDSETAIRLIDLMLRINAERKTTFIISTHDPMIMAKAARLVRLKDGAIMHSWQS